MTAALYNTQISQHPKTEMKTLEERIKLYNTQISQHPKTKTAIYHW